MKKINYFFCLISTLLVTACSDFLDEVDKDKLIPTTTEHYQAVLSYEFSGYQANFYGADFMSDNVEEYSYALESARKEWKNIYTWQMEIELDENNERLNNNVAWKDLYEDIGVANYVIELIDGALGSQAERTYIKGEAYFIRAWCYFQLANLYGLPYNPETAKVDLGVPLRTNNAISQTYERASVADTYDLIIDDLNKAKELIAESQVTKNKMHPSVYACDLLLSRTYLYMRNWELAEFYASEVIAENSLSKMVSNAPYITETRSDVLYTCNIKLGYSESDRFDKGWSVSQDLLDLYDDNDLRFKAFFQKVNGKLGNVYYPIKRTEAFTDLGYDYLRVAEAYLNRAEARWYLGGDAAGDLRTLLKSRYSKSEEVEIEEGENLLEQILVERRKELCFEGHHRWFDLRRMTNRPTIVHDYTMTDSDGAKLGVQRYTLLPDDKNYTLPIPLEERENNPTIKNNERYDKLPELI